MEEVHWLWSHVDQPSNHLDRRLELLYVDSEKVTVNGTVPYILKRGETMPPFTITKIGFKTIKMKKHIFVRERERERELGLPAVGNI